MPPFFSISQPPPTFTPASIIDLSTKVYIITSLSPSTLYLARILYNLHATIYFGCPSQMHFNSAVDKIHKACPESKGRLKPFLFDAAVSKSIGTAVNKFSEQEWRLDVLFLDTSGGDLLVAYALAKLLVPVLHTTASHFCHPNPSIRVVWMAPTSALPSTSETPDLSAADEVYLLAYAFSRLSLPPISMREDPPTHVLPNSNPSGVQHVCVTAALEQSMLQRSIQRFVPAMRDDKSEQSACTLLYAALGPDVRSGDWVVPRGRKGETTEHVRQGLAEKYGKAESISAMLYSHCGKRLEKGLDGEDESAL